MLLASVGYSAFQDGDVPLVPRARARATMIGSWGAFLEEEEAVYCTRIVLGAVLCVVRKCSGKKWKRDGPWGDGKGKKVCKARGWRMTGDG